MSTIQLPSDPQAEALIKVACAKLSLDEGIVALHRSRILTESQTQKQHFAIAETCTLANHGIIDGELLSSLGSPPDLKQNKGAKEAAENRVCALVLAAGAASRYVSPLEQLASALQASNAKNREPLQNAVRYLKQAGAENWMIPMDLRRLLKNPAILTEHQHLKDEIINIPTRPKALFPCTIEGTSFLQMKMAEHAALTHAGARLVSQVFINPVGSTGRFQEEAKLASPEILPPVFFVEQGPQLSTLRFRPNGKPWLSEDGEFSAVPAGHGATTRLFGDVARLGGGAETLFIRNIDNVSGTKEAAIQASKNFLLGFQYLLNHLRMIRYALAEPNIVLAGTLAANIHAKLFANGNAVPAMNEKTAMDALWNLLKDLFHSHRSEGPTLNEVDLLRWFFRRPLNVLGQVANTGRDVGGTPVLLKMPNGQLDPNSSEGPKSLLAKCRKLCIELPHATDEDTEYFLKDPAKATHFNPVFIAAEVPSDPQWYDSEWCRMHPFWLVARKTWRGEPVLYHESLLSEVLGNSVCANAVFVEIPRFLFNPHKTLADGAGKTNSDWLA